jgi:uncharacterized iron-regulated membrane protein
LSKATTARSAARGPWLAGYWTHPRKTWLRRALFQIHLWCGIAVGIIATVVGISGSAIVYKDSLDRVITPAMFRTHSGPRLSTDALMAKASATHPDWPVSYVAVGQSNPNTPNPWVFYLVPQTPGSALQLVYVDPANGAILGETGESSGLMNWLADLHFRLLGGSTGTVVNGIGAALLSVLSISGIFLWWPGRSRLGGSLTINMRARWPRLNWDLHNVFGFWSVIPLGIEGITGVYYCFFVPLSAVLVVLLGGSLHRWHEMSSPPRSTVVQDKPPAPIETLLQQGLRMHTDCTLRGIALPVSPTDPVTVQLDPPHAEDRGDYVQVAFDRYSGRVLSDMDSKQESFAIRAVNFIRPLHFGTFAGHFSRIAWIVVGLTPGLLFFTGFIMWWRRVPGRMLRSARR